METKNIPISKIIANNGQIEGLPKNPRIIKDTRFTKLVKSIEDAPEMLAMRQLIVVPYEKKYIVICGNMRLKACKEIGYKELPCYILPEDTPVEKLREYTIKDNIAFGETNFDDIANEWELQELDDWGFEIPDDWLHAGGNNKDATDDESNYTRKIEAPTYEPNGEKPDINELVDTKKRDALLAQIEDADFLNDEERRFLRLAAERHVIFNYAKIGDFYAHSRKDMQELMENSALVIIDYDKAIENGFVEMSNELLKIREKEDAEDDD